MFGFLDGYTQSILILLYKPTGLFGTRTAEER